MSMNGLENLTLPSIGFAIITILLGLSSLFIIYKAKKTFAFWLMLLLLTVILVLTILLFVLLPLPRFIVYSSIFIVLVLFDAVLFFGILKYKEVDAPTALSMDAMNSDIANRRLPKAVVLWISFFAILGAQFLLSDSPRMIVHDFQPAVQGRFSMMTGKVELLTQYSTDISFSIPNQADSVFFEVSANTFDSLTDRKTVTVLYLPTSHYVVDIRDASGKSLLK